MLFPNKEDKYERVFIVNIGDKKKFDWGKVDYLVFEIELQQYIARERKIRVYRICDEIYVEGKVKSKK